MGIAGRTLKVHRKGRAASPLLKPFEAHYPHTLALSYRPVQSYSVITFLLCSRIFRICQKLSNVMYRMGEEKKQKKNISFGCRLPL